MPSDYNPVREANRSLAVLADMAADIPAKLGELDAEQLDGLLLAARGGAAMLEGKTALQPAFQMAMAWWSLCHTEWGRRVHRSAAEAGELERVFALEG